MPRFDEHQATQLHADSAKDLEAFSGVDAWTLARGVESLWAQLEAERAARHESEMRSEELVYRLEASEAREAQARSEVVTARNNIPFAKPHPEQ